MRTFTIGLFLIALIAMTNCYNQDVQFLRTLKRQKFGKTILETIQVQMKSQNNQVDSILNLLRQLKSDNIADQEEAQKENDEYQAETAAIIAQARLDIQQQEATIQENLNLIASNEASIANEERHLAEQQALLAQNTDNLKQNLENQASNTQHYQDSFHQLSAQIAALAEAQQIGRQYFQELKTSLTQGTQSEFAQISTNMKKMRFTHPKFQGLINVLAQLLQDEHYWQQNEELSVTLDNILTHLLEELRAELVTLTNNYNQRDADLKSQEATFRANLASAQSQIDAAQQEIAELKAENVNAAQVVAETRQQLASSQALLADNLKAAADAQAAYEASTKQRSQELTILNKVIEIFETRFTSDVKALVSEF